MCRRTDQGPLLLAKSGDPFLLGFSGMNGSSNTARYPPLPAANFTPLAHLPAPRRHIAPNSSVLTRIGRPPTLASRAAMRGSESPALISRLSVATIAGGVPAGTPIPGQPPTP